MMRLSVGEISCFFFLTPYDLLDDLHRVACEVQIVSKSRTNFRRRSLEFYDLLPEDPKLYDKMRPPKKDGQATVVYFHVTVMGLDSIDETSMVRISRGLSMNNLKNAIFGAIKYSTGFQSFSYAISLKLCCPDTISFTKERLKGMRKKISYRDLS